MKRRKVLTRKITSLGRSKKWPAALKLFYNSNEKHLYTFTAAMTACIRCGRGQEAMELYAEMKKSGIKPSIVSVWRGSVCAGSLWGLHGLDSFQ
mmetsp:Transcript_22400/g.59518  ORF Transcript_22400/g.59518 Transcript_22400/m.59518 type:complete len:94 (-) Transcript_22400:821-1102(-)